MPTRFHSLVTVALVVAPLAMGAQGVPPTPMPAAAPPPPPVTAPAPVTPPENAVALCSDDTFVLAPATVAACDARGGLKVAMPPRRVPPPAPDTAPGTAPGMAPVPMLMQVAPEATPPAGATMRCKDGTWLTGSPAGNRCVERGGVATILPPERVTPPQLPLQQP